MLKLINSIEKLNLGKEILLSQFKVVIIGAINIDIFASGLNDLPEAGLQENGSAISMSAGGKACNMARMSAALLPAIIPQGGVALMAKTVKNEGGLWQLLLRDLEKAGVASDLLVMTEPEEGELPTVALMLRVKDDARRVLYFPGRNESLSSIDIDAVDGCFKRLAEANGLLILTGEMPAETLRYALDKAAKLGIRAMVDPGGANQMEDYRTILDKPVYMLKPNALEAEQLSGVNVNDFPSARQAAKRMMTGGVLNVLITHGEHGAYLFGTEGDDYIEAVQTGQVIETTGSGDQLMAVIAAGILSGMVLSEAVPMGVKAATIQCTRAGTQPLRWDDFRDA